MIHVTSYTFIMKSTVYFSNRQSANYQVKYLAAGRVYTYIGFLKEFFNSFKSSCSLV